MGFCVLLREITVFIRMISNYTKLNQTITSTNNVTVDSEYMKIHTFAEERMNK